MKVDYGNKFYSITVTYETSFEFAEDLPKWLARGFTFSQALSGKRPDTPNDTIQVSYQSMVNVTREEIGL